MNSVLFEAAAKPVQVAATLSFSSYKKKKHNQDRPGRLCGIGANVMQSPELARHCLLERLYRESWSDLCRQLQRLYGNPPDPEDVAQEAFTRLSQVKNIDDIENPRAFVFKIAFNVALKSIHHLQRARNFLSEQLNNEDRERQDISPERIVSSQQHIEATHRGFMKLTQKQRTILMRSRIKGDTYAAISLDTGWSQADISRQLKRALALLEEAVSECDI
ncbi:RNA polymerase sigma factor [Marinagarivorans algicola]|uniref:RNA polymerase sigma factor n=1 Tax=Marinagarivorans algicola TaxID=1513270 RepID=UPI0037350B8A